ncbi:PRC-barrel domain-containing protein [Paracoccus zeaxanthinifaciens]|uniref:PRC-barrel domain-containing protein n=1 Tax=Paracoccus zeaxanthinifaciens TaxID=187400 RepID=UPI0003B787F1|nr:PRC-barrel domain-containing protein [Paracoccus zeaxanthinifaciens]
MKILTRNLLLGTAITLPLGGAALAQSLVDINEQQLEGKSQECRMLADAYRDADDPTVIPQTEVVAAINRDMVQECTALEERLTQGASDDVTEQADGDETAKASDRVDLSEDAIIEGQAEVTVPDPEVDVQVPAPAVTVTEQQPEISVTRNAADIQVSQKQPTVAVEIPEIIVRVDNPAPDIYILNPDPDVSVTAADPEVQVEQGKPGVSVTQADPELNVDLGVDADGNPVPQDQARDTTEIDDGSVQNANDDTEIATPEPQVEIVQAEGEPNVSVEQSDPDVAFEGAEPQVSLSMAKQPTVEVQQTGQPNVVIETPEERQQRLAAQEGRQADSQEAEAEAQPQGREMSVAELSDLEVVTADGEDLGNPEAFVDLDGEPNLVLSSGGFLGLGGKEIPVPMSRVTVDEERLVVDSMTEDDIEAANDFEYDSDAVLPDDRMINLS